MGGATHCMRGEHGHALIITQRTRVGMWQAGGFRTSNPAIAKGCTLVVGTTQGLYASVKAHPTHLVLVCRPAPLPACSRCCDAADNWHGTRQLLRG
jgi:hypothetical protein